MRVDRRGVFLAALAAVAMSLAGLGAGGVASAGVAADVTAPVVTTQHVTAFVFKPKHVFRYTATDNKSGVAGYDVRYRWSTANTAFTAWEVPIRWHGTQAQSVDYSLGHGETLCLSVRAFDKAANVSPWSPGLCTSRMIDDRHLPAALPWQRNTAVGDYRGTDTSTTSANAVLQSHPVYAKTVAIAVTTQPGGGRLAVSIGDTSLGIIDTAASTLQHQVVDRLIGTAVDRGPIVLTSLDDGLPVAVDGYGVSPG